MLYHVYKKESSPQIIISYLNFIQNCQFNSSPILNHINQFMLRYFKALVYLFLLLISRINLTKSAHFILSYDRNIDNIRLLSMSLLIISFSVFKDQKNNNTETINSQHASHFIFFKNKTFIVALFSTKYYCLSKPCAKYSIVIFDFHDCLKPSAIVLICITIEHVRL